LNTVHDSFEIHLCYFQHHCVKVCEHSTRYRLLCSAEEVCRVCDDMWVSK